MLRQDISNKEELNTSPWSKTFFFKEGQIRPICFDTMVKMNNALQRICCCSLHFPSIQKVRKKCFLIIKPSFTTLFGLGQNKICHMRHIHLIWCRYTGVQLNCSPVPVQFYKNPVTSQVLVDVWKKIMLTFENSWTIANDCWHIFCPYLFDTYMKEKYSNEEIVDQGRSNCVFWKVNLGCGIINFVHLPKYKHTTTPFE
jgi:hypothetical protein